MKIPASIRPRDALAAALLVSCLAVCPGVSVAAGQEVIDRVLAVVAGDLIMLSDVQASRDLGLVNPGDAPDPDRAVLSRLIDRALMLDEVERYAPAEPDAESIDRSLAGVRARFQSTQTFEEGLARVGLDVAQLRERLRQDLRIRAYLEQRFSADTPESEQAMIDAWVAGLRRRADVLDRYATAPRP